MTKTEKRSNLSTILGIAGGVVALVAGFIIEGGRLVSLYSISALIIVLGGTISATLTSFTLGDIVKIPALFMKSLSMPRTNEPELILMFAGLAEKARRDGLLVLETDVEHEFSSSQYDPLIRSGLSLVVDGAEPELIVQIMRQEIREYDERRKREIALFESAGGYSPTMGIIGTVLGLIRVLGMLADPTGLGSAIALAFVATLYGVGLANLFWLPVAGKLKLRTKAEKTKKELIVGGIMSIQAGDNPRITREKLLAFLDEDARKSVESIPVEAA